MQGFPTSMESSRLSQRTSECRCLSTTKSFRYQSCSIIQLSWEPQPRTEGIVRVAAGGSMRSAMEQSLSTLRKYDLYGIHFNFDKATMRPESASLVKDIALTLTHNPTWILQINGHTDSIGNAAYNQKLSAARAKSRCPYQTRHSSGPPSDGRSRIHPAKGR
jgi:flagellar motor protein MotB